MENVTLITHISGGAMEIRIGFELNAMKNILAVIGQYGNFIDDPLTPVNKAAFEASSKSASLYGFAELSLSDSRSPRLGAD